MRMMMVMMIIMTMTTKIIMLTALTMDRANEQARSSTASKPKACVMHFPVPSQLW